MQFNSTIFLAFLVIVVVVFHQLTIPYRRAFLLLASYAFYWVWSIPFSLLLLGSTFVDYTAARWIEASPRNAVRRLALMMSMMFNLGALGLFKYSDFLTNSAYSLFGVHPWPVLDLILPLGISFYTFQTMSYTIDVYRRQIPARRSLMDVALYVSFFPQLVAGPIVRADVLMPQLGGEDRPLDWTRMRRGLGLLLWGMTKKVLIADAMGNIANEVYGAPERFGGIDLVMGTYAFAAQIYCDFSGYTDIALGAALLIGIRLPKNFESPYLACSIGEFWRRWHISLSTWLRDYLYIPLGGNRRGVRRTYFNLMATMLLGGLWHGAGWNWVVWGGLQGGMLCFEKIVGLSAKPRNRLTATCRWFITLNLVCLSWVFFRAHGLDEAMLVLQRVCTGAAGSMSVGWLPVVYLGGIIIAEYFGIRRRWLAFSETSPRGLTWIAYAMVILFVLIFAGPSNPEFIYFQF